jgi:hypothetical protein
VVRSVYIWRRIFTDPQIGAVRQANPAAGGVRRRARTLKPKLRLFAQKAKRHRVRVEIVHRAWERSEATYGSTNALKNKTYHR